ncbi:MAG: thioredoxin [Bacteroidota bacterium]
MKNTVVLTDSNFDEIIQTSQLVIVDFWAEWCGPCRMMNPALEELALDYKGKAVIGKLNVDENPAITARFGVRSAPTLLFFRNREIVDKQIGAVPKSALIQKLKAIA